MTGTLIVNLTKAEVEAILIAHVADKVHIEDLMVMRSEKSVGECEFIYRNVGPELFTAKITIEVSDNE